MNLNVNVKVDLEFLLDFFSLFAVFHVSLAISARLEFGMLRYSSRHKYGLTFYLNISSLEQICHQPHTLSCFCNLLRGTTVISEHLLQINHLIE